MENEAASPWIAITPAVMMKAAASIVLMSMGMYYMATGRKNADMSRILTGAALVLLSIFIF